MATFNSTRNYGFGKTMSYAARNAFEEHFGGGHFGSVAAHAQRVELTIAWAKENGFNKWDKFDQGAFDKYSEHIKQCVDSGTMSVRYAQNVLSSTNVVMAAMRGDSAVRVSPSLVGQRQNVRTTAPTGMDRGTVSAAQSAMRDTGLNRAAAVVGLAREFGMRLREASLQNLNRIAKEATTLGRINVQEGTKGGRTADRWIEISKDSQMQAIRDALTARPIGSENLLERTERLTDFVSGEIASARQQLKEKGVEKFHDLRSAYACERYEEKTGHPAPVLREEGEARPDRSIDHQARMEISEEMGHGREEVVAAYIGGKR